MQKLLKAPFFANCPRVHFSRPLRSPNSPLSNALSNSNNTQSNLFKRPKNIQLKPTSYKHQKYQPVCNDATRKRWRSIQVKLNSCVPRHPSASAARERRRDSVTEERQSRRATSRPVVERSLKLNILKKYYA
jgi:hypothetical protein